MIARIKNIYRRREGIWFIAEHAVYDGEDTYGLGNTSGLQEREEREPEVESERLSRFLCGRILTTEPTKK